MDMPSVCAVVLTYNRRELLERCLAAIEAQTRPVDRILVVDNGSTDGTAAFLAARAAQDGARLQVRRLERNTGAAGGFSFAMQQGHRSGADHLWVMDDDVLPAPEALQRLLDADDELRARAIEAPFLVSVARAPGGELTNVPDLDERRNRLDYPTWPMLLAQRLVPVTRATFVSMLLPRTTLERHGLPIADMFIWGEDSEFTRRVTVDRPGWLVGGSEVLHVRAQSGRLDIRTEHDPVRVGWHALKLRNDVYMARQRLGRRRVATLFWSEARAILLLAMSGQRRKAWVLAAGLLAGLRFTPTVPRLETPVASQTSNGQAASLSEIVETGSGQAMPS